MQTVVTDWLVDLDILLSLETHQIHDLCVYAYSSAIYNYASISRSCQEFPLFVIWTTLYNYMSALPFGWIFSSILIKKTTMITV